MSSPLIIRPVVPADFEQWERLWEGYNKFYGRSGATALPEEIIRMTWSRFFDAYEPMYALVAEEGEELLGLVHYIFHRSTIMINRVLAAAGLEKGKKCPPALASERHAA